jgi:hypothetical protein
MTIASDTVMTIVITLSRGVTLGSDVRMMGGATWRSQCGRVGVSSAPCSVPCQSRYTVPKGRRASVLLMQGPETSDGAIGNVKATMTGVRPTASAPLIRQSVCSPNVAKLQDRMLRRSPAPLRLSAIPKMIVPLAVWPIASRGSCDFRMVHQRRSTARAPESHDGSESRCRQKVRRPRG